MKEWGLQRRRRQGCQVWLSRFRTAQPGVGAQSRPTLSFQERILEQVVISYSRGLPNPGIEPVILHRQVDSFFFIIIIIIIF